MAAPYVNMKFMPTGGVNAKNLTSYLDFPKIIACGGSWMAVSYTHLDVYKRQGQRQSLSAAWI